MTTETRTTQSRRWSAAELRRLPAAQQEAILELAAEQAEEEYRTNLELTDFEAFGKGDLQAFGKRGLRVVSAKY